MPNWSDKYSKLQLLGSGSSGQIFKILKKDTHELLAAKIISPTSSQSQLNSIQLQTQIMSSTTHPNILKCHGIQLFQHQIWIILEYCQGGSLTDMMHQQRTTFKEGQISTIMRQVLEGLQYLHKRKIVHRDIKASNLLYHEGMVKIADFGVAMKDGGQDDQKLSKIGSPFWMSPQTLSQSSYSDKTDIWALGITVIELAQGQPPYSHQHPFRAIYSIQTHPPSSLTSPSEWSKDFNNFVKQCLTIEVKHRPCAQKLLKHPFITNKSAQQSLASSPSQLSQQNTIIQHQELPKSIWEKCSYPQTQQKMIQEESQHSSDQNFQNTVVINQNVNSSISLFSNFKKTIEEEQLLSSAKPIIRKNKQNMISNQQMVQGVEEKEVKVKQLYKMMEEQVKIVRKKYMAKIRQLYLPHSQSKWASPVRKLKQKNSQSLRNRSSKFSSSLLKKIL